MLPLAAGICRCAHFLYFFQTVVSGTDTGFWNEGIQVTVKFSLKKGSISETHKF